MIANNIIAFFTHLIISFISMILYPQDREISITLYVFILMLYFLLIFSSGKNLTYYKSKTQNILSLSSPLFLLVITFIFELFKFYPGAFLHGFLIYPSYPLIKIVEHYELYIPLFSILLLLPSIISMWLGLEIWKKWDNKKNKK